MHERFAPDPVHGQLDALVAFGQLALRPDARCECNKAKECQESEV